MNRYQKGLCFGVSHSFYILNIEVDNSILVCPRRILSRPPYSILKGLRRCVITPLVDNTFKTYMCLCAGAGNNKCETNASRDILFVNNLSCRLWSQADTWPDTRVDAQPLFFFFFFFLDILFILGEQFGNMFAIFR